MTDQPPAPPTSPQNSRDPAPGIIPSGSKPARRRAASVPSAEPIGVDVIPDPPSLPRDFAEQQEHWVASPPVPMDPPPWFLREVNKGTGLEELLRILAQRVPKQTDLREAQQVLNEIGHHP